MHGHCMDLLEARPATSCDLLQLIGGSDDLTGSEPAPHPACSSLHSSTVQVSQVDVWDDAVTRPRVIESPKAWPYMPKLRGPYYMRSSLDVCSSVLQTSTVPPSCHQPVVRCARDSRVLVCRESRSTSGSSAAASGSSGSWLSPDSGGCYVRAHVVCTSIHTRRAYSYILVHNTA